MYSPRINRSEHGFTLVEVSIVLVVIGLLIGSVLVAVNILQNARITSAISTLQSIQSAVSTYNQNYGAVPGDDDQATVRFGAEIFKGGGDGIVGASALSETFTSTATATNGNGATESLLVWSHLRSAGLIKGQGKDFKQPGNPFGGVYGIQNGAFSANGIGLRTNVVCMSSVPGSAAVIIDQRQDDGKADEGNIRGGTSVTGAASGSSGTTSGYVDTATYVLCTRAL